MCIRDRYHILWAGVALMLLSVLLTLFTSMANDGSVWDFAYLTEQAVSYTHLCLFFAFSAGDILKIHEKFNFIENQRKKVLRSSGIVEACLLYTSRCV